LLFHQRKAACSKETPPKPHKKAVSSLVSSKAHFRRGGVYTKQITNASIFFIFFIFLFFYFWVPPHWLARICNPQSLQPFHTHIVGARASRPVLPHGRLERGRPARIGRHRCPFLIYGNE
jgi:hypothetical protein